jgi:hypothetical protein
MVAVPPAGPTGPTWGPVMGVDTQRPDRPDGRGGRGDQARARRPRRPGARQAAAAGPDSSRARAVGLEPGPRRRTRAGLEPDSSRRAAGPRAAHTIYTRVVLDSGTILPIRVVVYSLDGFHLRGYSNGVGKTSPD